jgi:hypothetical protein
VVEGGLPSEIAETIYLRKTPGCGTFGTTAISVPVVGGLNSTIRFQIPVPVPIFVRLFVENLTAGLDLLISQAITDYINSLRPGDDIVVSRIYLPAQLYGASQIPFEVSNIRVGVTPFANIDTVLPTLYNQTPVCSIGNITLVPV